MEKSPKKIIKIKDVKEIAKTPEDKEITDVIEYVKCLKSLELKASPIGFGGNAIVYTAFGTPFEKICFKKIKEKPQIICNDIDEEHKFQIMARQAGVRTPFSIMSIKTDDGEYLIMERIEGNSVEEIVDQPYLLPENFNVKTFFDSLDQEIAKLHKAGVYHRDLHLRNVMIDKEGLAVIIDFGTAIEGTGSDFTYEVGVSIYNEKKGHYEIMNGYFKDDLVRVKQIKVALKKLT